MQVDAVQFTSRLNHVVPKVSFFLLTEYHLSFCKIKALYKKLKYFCYIYAIEKSP